MSRRNWKHLQPASIRNALELCKDHARERRNLSVEQIADRIGLADHHTLYKWIQTGRIPGVMIRVYESVCGIDYVTRWVAASGGYLLITMPTGRKVDASDIQYLQAVVNEAIGQLIKFHAEAVSAQDTLAALQNSLEHIAWHHRNVAQHTQPQLELAP